MLAANSIQMPFNSLILHGFGGHFYRQYSLLVCNTKIKPGRLYVSCLTWNCHIGEYLRDLSIEVKGRKTFLIEMSRRI